jgi:hypothetical protein
MGLAAKAEVTMKLDIIQPKISVKLFFILPPIGCYSFISICKVGALSWKTDKNRQKEYSVEVLMAGM